MTEKIQTHDFVEVEYTGQLTDGTIFDTTSEKVAKEQQLGEKRTFGPIVICIGEHQILPGLDAQLVGKEISKEYTITLSPEQAFGKRDIKKMRIVPASTFREHKMDPHPGLQIDMDGELGTVTQISGGRVIVNFNHPLSGKEVTYKVTVRRRVTDKKEQITAYLHTAFGLPAEQIKTELQEDKAVIELPLALPKEITELIGKKMEELITLKEIVFKNKEPAKSEKVVASRVQ